VGIDVTPIFAEHLARNRGPDPRDPGHRQAPDYGIVASLEGDVLEVELTFRTGSAYCCYEWGCHVAFTPITKRWDDIRVWLLARGLRPPERIELRRTVVIDEGAVFFDFRQPDPTRRGWYAFAPVSARRYQWTTIEVPDQEVDADPDHMER
jgi:hypothetical protein